jgi:hypothetical protein
MILSLNYNVNNPSFIKLSKVIREPLKRPKKVLERHPKLYIYTYVKGYNCRVSPNTNPTLFSTADHENRPITPLYNIEP